MAKTFQKKSQSIGVDDHGAATATFSVDILIVYEMHFHLKSEITEASLHGSWSTLSKKPYSTRFLDLADGLANPPTVSSL